MTRYPKSGKGSKWTVKELDSITPDWKGDKLSDSGGLVGQVRLNASGKISVAFSYGFKWEGKKVWYYCGIYPSSDLSHIRQERDWAREMLKSGVDPRLKKETNKIEAREAHEAIVAKEIQRKSEALTVRNMFDVWVADGVKRKNGNQAIISSFSKYILPAIGDLQIKKLDENHLNKIYKEIVAQGKYATAHELFKDVKQMFCWAEIRKPWRNLLVDGNPTRLVEIDKILPSNYTKVRDRVLSADEIRKLRDLLDEVSKKYLDAKNKYHYERPIKIEVQLAIWLCLSTICRIGELLMTEWKDVNFEKRTWFIPAKNTKKNGKKDTRTDHIVYLSDFALERFQKLYSITGDTEWAFPARYKDGHVCIKSASKIIGDRQLKFKSRSRKLKCRVENNSLVVGDAEWTPHDLRTTGSTMMQELGVSRDVINLCQHHTIGSKVDRHYLHYDYEKEKKEAWARLGKHIEDILSNNLH